MLQDSLIQCVNQEHHHNVNLICFDESCKENKLYCMLCSRRGIHSSHPQHQYQLPILYEHIEKIDNKCDQFVNNLKQIMDSINLRFNQLIGGIRNKYQKSKEQFLNLNSIQMNLFFEKSLQFESYVISFKNQITQDLQKLHDQLQNFYLDLKLSELNYYQISNSDIEKSQQLYQEGYSIYWYEDNYLEAIKLLDQALIWNPKNQFALWCKAENFSYNFKDNLDQYTEAIKWADKALEINPKYIQALSCKAGCLRMNEQYQEAIIWTDKALDIDPRYKFSLGCKADSLRMLNQFQEAIMWADKALEIDSKHELLLGCKGQCLQSQNQYQIALIIYENLLQINPNNLVARIGKNECLEALRER